MGMDMGMDMDLGRRLVDTSDTQRCDSVGVCTLVYAF